MTPLGTFGCSIILSPSLLLTLPRLFNHDIKVLLLPLHTSHLTQPLDFGVFGPLKTAATKEMDIHKQARATLAMKRCLGCLKVSCYNHDHVLGCSLPVCSLPVCSLLAQRALIMYISNREILCGMLVFNSIITVSYSSTVANNLQYEAVHVISACFLTF